ncbi:MAG: hypothetical protein IJ316_05470 [Clostridia bacterium]|nr:hypothetical protein [Clostridia bacterium]
MLFNDKKKIRVNEKIKKLGEEIAREFINPDTLHTDPLGSWTGTPMDRDDKPTQDADDL